jgi:hypothetical protein
MMADRPAPEWWRVTYDVGWGDRVRGYFENQANAYAFAAKMALWRPTVEEMAWVDRMEGLIPPGGIGMSGEEGNEVAE